MKVLYTAFGHASGDGRNGHVSTDDGLIDLDVRIPKEMGGPGGATNPEQLFAVGYAACFHSALKLVARTAGVDVAESVVSASVGLGVDDSGAFGIAVQLDVHLPGMADDVAADLAEKAHAVCPYSNATRGNVDVVLTVV